MYYSELENCVYPKIFVLCIIKNWRIMFTSRYLYYVYLKLENYAYPQDICIMYYSELEKYVYPKILVLCIIQYLRIMFTPGLADLTIES